MATEKQKSEVKARFDALCGKPLYENEGFILYVRYVPKTDKMEIGTPTNNGFAANAEVKYNHLASLDENLECALYEAERLYQEDKRGAS